MAQHPRIFPIEEDEDEKEPELNGPMEVLTTIMECGHESSTPNVAIDSDIDQDHGEEQNNNVSLRDHVSDNSLGVNTDIIDSNSSSTKTTPNIEDENEENGDDGSVISNLASHDEDDSECSSDLLLQIDHNGECKL